MAEITITDKEILQLWRSPTFEGSYRGIRTFQVLLKTNLNIKKKNDHNCRCTIVFINLYEKNGIKYP